MRLEVKVKPTHALVVYPLHGQEDEIDVDRVSLASVEEALEEVMGKPTSPSHRNAFVKWLVGAQREVGEYWIVEGYLGPPKRYYAAAVVVLV